MARCFAAEKGFSGLDVPEDGERHRDEDVVAGLPEPAGGGLVVHGGRPLVLVEGDHPRAEPDAAAGAPGTNAPGSRSIPPSISTRST